MNVSDSRTLTTNLEERTVTCCERTGLLVRGAPSAPGEVPHLTTVKRTGLVLAQDGQTVRMGKCKPVL